MNKSLLFRFLGLTFINKVMFFVLDIIYVSGDYPHLSVYLSAQAVSLLAIPFSLYIFPYLYKYFKFWVVWGILIVVSFSTIFYLSDLISIFTLYCCYFFAFVIFQINLQRYLDVKRAINISSLHVFMQILVFLFLYEHYAYNPSLIVLLVFVIYSFFQVKGKLVEVLGAFPDGLPIAACLSNFTRTGLVAILRSFLIYSEYSFLLILSRISNQLVSLLFTAIFGKKSGVSAIVPTKRFYVYIPLVLASFLASYIYISPEFIVFCLVTVVVLELAIYEARCVRSK